MFANKCRKWRGQVYIHAWLETYDRQLSDTLAGKLYFPSMMWVSTSFGVPQANGDRPVVIMNKMTPRLHTSMGGVEKGEKVRVREGVRE